MLDTVRELATPEGCVIPLRLAGPVSRGRAWLIDAAIRLVAFMILAETLAVLGRFGGGLLLVAAFALEWLYPVVFEVWGGGATPGKRMCGMLVLHDEGTPVGLAASLTRNTLRFVDFLPALYGVGFVAMLASRDGKRLGDLVAGTVVVHRAEPEKTAAPAAGGAPQPPRVALRLAEQRAIIEYAQRVGRLTPERAEELALIAAPLTGARSGPLAQKRLLAIADFLLGRR